MISWVKTLRSNGVTIHFNCWRGCTRISESCRFCYAEKLSHRNPAVLGVWGPHGTRVVAAESYWRLPRKWDRDAAKAGERRRVFCASLADVFEEWNGYAVNADGLCMWDLPQGWTPTDMKLGVRMLTLDGIRARLWQTILNTPWLDWLLLTKRPENVLPILRRVYDLQKSRALDDGCLAAWIDGSHPPDNVWIGVSCEDQATADERIPHLLKIPAAVRFLSCEPLLGPVDLDPFFYPESCSFSHECRSDHWPGKGAMPDPLSNVCGGRPYRECGCVPIDWVITGGESGPGARPSHPDWFRSLRDQCRAASVAYHHKQNGEWLADGQGIPFLMDVAGGRGSHRVFEFPDVVMRRVGKRAAGRLLDGVEHNEFPTPEVARARHM